jgi:hypothetical protein
VSGERQDHDEQAGRNRGNIAAIVVIIVLVVGGYWLYSTLKHANDLQVCAERGLRNCGQQDP